MRVQLSSLRTLAGATSAIVPFAIGVHLAAEALALGGAGLAFWQRHAYLLLPLALALWSFAQTVGLGRRHAEMVRRCALVRARLRDAGGGSTIAAFTAANLGFFGITQLLEGVPIASGAGGGVTGLVAAVAGSLLAALIIFFWARSFVAIALAIAVARARNARAFERPRRRIVAVSRAAASAFTLFVPNRPPPFPSFV